MLILSQRIAVVDDDPSILRALRRLLGAAGFTVNSVGSGEELLAGAGRGTPEAAAALRCWLGSATVGHAVTEGHGCHATLVPSITTVRRGRLRGTGSPDERSADRSVAVPRGSGVDQASRPHDRRLSHAGAG